ncbi:rod shape-determining protein MreD [Altererythrobacter salegens]|uniref:Rod shape-determining protein MreD n=1 Tax=Croceibacterium salegens TaxID=1737568 RepID=A0A6I4SUY2_9SPHN|nr:rod shape-determining protein MreD [Croceibacterium salegens]MXO58887.1 rod shape-determining protein MreD [Croceibacterium salegens]
MIDPINPRSRQDAFGSKINRDHSPALVYGVPWISILLGSLTPLLPIIAPAPLLPPIAFVFMVAWRQLRPGLLPLWAGLPFGAFDDLFSGQPFGSGILLFSLALIGLDLLDLRFPWRGFWQDWFIASGLLAAYILLAAVFSGSQVGGEHLVTLMPQFLLSLFSYPIIARMVSQLDRFRLFRVRRLG